MDRNRTLPPRLQALLDKDESDDTRDFFTYAIAAFSGEFLMAPTHWDDSPARRRCAGAVLTALSLMDTDDVAALASQRARRPPCRLIRT